MNQSVKAILFVVVAFVIVALAEALGIPPLTTPGYLVVKAFRQLPEPYPMVPGVHPPYRAAVSVVSDVFWLSVLSAWFVIVKARSSRIRSVQTP